MERSAEMPISPNVDWLGSVLENTRMLAGMLEAPGSLDDHGFPSRGTAALIQLRNELARGGYDEELMVEDADALLAAGWSESSLYRIKLPALLRTVALSMMVAEAKEVTA